VEGRRSYNNLKSKYEAVLKELEKAMQKKGCSKCEKLQLIVDQQREKIEK